MAGINIGGGASEADSSSEASYTQRTPVAMDLAPGYQFMFDQFLNEYFGYGKFAEYTQKTEQLEAAKTELEAIANATEVRVQGDTGSPSSGDIFAGSFGMFDPTAPLSGISDLVNRPSDQGHTQDELAALSTYYQQEVDELESWFVENPYSEDSTYLGEYETASQGIQTASTAVTDYMATMASLVPDAYQSASDQYNSYIDNIISQAMSGSSFQEELPEGIVDQMLAGISISIGGGSPMSFAPAGAAEAVASLYNTRAEERTGVMGLLAELAQAVQESSVIPAEQQYEYGLLPLTTALDNAEQYPENLGWFMAMDELRGLWEPMFYTTTTLGGDVPIIDASSSSESESSSWDANVGVGI